MRPSAYVPEARPSPIASSKGAIVLIGSSLAANSLAAASSSGLMFFSNAFNVAREALASAVLSAVCFGRDFKFFKKRFPCAHKFDGSRFKKPSCPARVVGANNLPSKPSISCTSFSALPLASNSMSKPLSRTSAINSLSSRESDSVPSAISM